MKDEALKMALEALEQTLQTLDDENAKPGGAIADTIWHSEHETLFDYLGSEITAIKEALAQPAQEPVQKPTAVVSSCTGAGDKGVRVKWLGGFPQIGDPLYTTPPQRPWVGLTDEEKDGKRLLENGLLFNAAEVQAWELGVEYAESILKDKNNG